MIKPVPTPSLHQTFAALVGVGVGLRTPHHPQFLSERPDVAWLEVHSENFFDDGPGIEVLERLRTDYPVSLHGVGLSLGSADRLDIAHLAHLRRLADRIAPQLMSEHLCWGAIGERHLNDLLPMPYSSAALTLICERIDAAQNALGRTLLIENVSSYLRWQQEEYSEWDFIASMAQRTGCGLLVDVNNIYVSAINHGFDAHTYLAALPAASVGELHLAGHESQQNCLIDTHSRPVCDEVWDLYREALRLYGARPTLIEWDNDIPAVEVLLAEAATARTILEQHHA